MPLIDGYFGSPLISATRMSRNTGKSIYDTEHLKLCILDILTTPKGSRVMLRDYGSNFFDLLDRNIDSTLVMDMIAETYDALDRWEPRLKLTQVQVDLSSWETGVAGLTLYGYYFLSGQPIRLDDVFLDFYKRQATLDTPY